MHLTIRQAASYLGVPERTVRRWIANRGLPAHRVNEQFHCNAIELWEWAVVRLRIFSGREGNWREFYLFHPEDISSICLIPFVLARSQVVDV